MPDLRSVWFDTQCNSSSHTFWSPFWDLQQCSPVEFEDKATQDPHLPSKQRGRDKLGHSPYSTAVCIIYSTGCYNRWQMSITYIYWQSFFSFVGKLAKKEDLWIWGLWKGKPAIDMTDDIKYKKKKKNKSNQIKGQILFFLCLDTHMEGLCWSKWLNVDGK